MLVTLNDVLPKARDGHYAVGLFNTTDTDMLQAVIEAAEETRSPVIIGTAEVLLPYGELQLIAPAILARAKAASVPVVMHYDHGLTFDRCIEALKLGFSSIMFDGSIHEYSENIAQTSIRIPTKKPALLPPAEGASMNSSTIARVSARKTMKHTAQAFESMI